jgi:hypothetical protein
MRQTMRARGRMLALLEVCEFCTNYIDLGEVDWGVVVLANFIVLPILYLIGYLGGR